MPSLGSPRQRVLWVSGSVTNTPVRLERGSGEDLVSDFDPSEDVAQLVGFEEGFDALAALNPQAGGTELDLGGGNSVLFVGRTLAEFSADDFLIL